MIIYENSKEKFILDVKSNSIDEIIKSKFLEKGIFGGSQNEQRSWSNSLHRMQNIIDTNEIKNDAYVTLEYKPNSFGERIDFMIFGEDENQNQNFVIVELKQWEKAEDTGKRDMVKTFIGKGIREELHPSYQAWQYLHILNCFNKNVQDKKLNGYAVSFLHNARTTENKNLLNEVLYSIIKKVSIFLKEDTKELTETIKKYVSHGKGKKILYEIENSKIVPARHLVDVASKIFKGNKEYELISNQKIVYENIVSKINGENNVFIINGNPGTGKSVLGINLLAEFIKNKKMAKLCAPNASFRNSLKNSIIKKDGQKNFKYLFSSSGEFIKIGKDSYDWVIVDEAHRLKGKGTWLYKGRSQIEDILKASKNTIFFYDERQTIRSDDIGLVENFLEEAKKLDKNIFFGDEWRLKTQFRCSGQDGYINALLNSLQIQSTGNHYLNESEDFVFEIMDDPNKMLEVIKDYNFRGNKARMLAGYAWKWRTKKLSKENIETENDIIIKEKNFAMPWNHEKEDSWMDGETVNQVGCVHTTQGLELEYAGIIVGNDLKVTENGEIIACREEYFDIKGKSKTTDQELTKYIKNIYFILFTRAQKGVFVYFVNKNTEKHFKKFIKNNGTNK